MERLTNWRRGQCVVVHSNRLVTEDLRQLLLEKGAAEVVTAEALTKVVPGWAAVLFVEGSAAKLAQSQFVQAWQRFGTPVIAMNGRATGLAGHGGLHTLEQPFRSEDVMLLLTNLKVF